jgi:hypothetical protein
VTEELEETARQIAEQGRDALVGRLRPAFEEAAEAHSDTLTLDDEQLERLVERAADGADGLQWRRALASVASEQLGIGLGEALAHPAVVRAHAIVGAPPYEAALVAITGGHAMPPADVVRSEPAEDAGSESDAVGDESASEPENENERELEPELGHDEDHESGLRPPGAEPLRLRAVHVGGIANLPTGTRDLELRFSDAGLDIAREGKALGRLTWNEITTIETPEPAGRRRRRQRAAGTIVVRSASGRATFEIPGVSAGELREQLAPLIEERL